MDRFTFFDVEYANPKNKSICQIGISCEDAQTRDPIFPELSLYIDPEDDFSDVCVGVHGITPERVHGAPTFPEVWKKIEPYFTNSIVVGHNVASSDLSALVRSLRRYNIVVPELYYICTLELARRFVPSFAVQSYKLGPLCSYFDVEIDSAHDALGDACATSDLFRELVRSYGIDWSSFVRLYQPEDVSEFEQFISSPDLRRSISEFYGIVRGISIDHTITPDETAYIVAWRDAHRKYSAQPEMHAIFSAIDRIAEDGVITLREAVSLQGTIKDYLHVVQTSPVTLATQILNGIMKGISLDGEISGTECESLRLWLYDNIYLTGHYPFDRILAVVEDALEDGIVTQDEAAEISKTIGSLLDPVAALSKSVNDVSGKHVCLSGNFSYGPKSAVEKYITERGGLIDATLKKGTDVLLVGDCECRSFSNGTYGTKVKKAMEYNEKGCDIQILKEADFFAAR